MFTDRKSHLSHAPAALIAALLAVSSIGPVFAATNDNAQSTESRALELPVAGLGGRGMCVVKINGRDVRTLTALDRNDCYAKTSFGSENCAVYAPYLKFGVANVIQQIFNGTDQVNSERCVLPPTCVVKVRGVVVNTMTATDRDACYQQSSFGSDNCATYSPYFTAGNNLLEQYFNGTDRVNSEICVK